VERERLTARRMDVGSTISTSQLQGFPASWLPSRYFLSSDIKQWR
jgi:hypothetical protein